MSATVEFLLHHGYLLLFAWVLGEQLGLPLPSAPLLLAAGALAGTHRMNLELAIALPIVTVVICDFFWYQLGRLKGMKVLQWLCRVSLEPDSWVRQTQVRFERYGPWQLAVTRFVPGMNIVALPLAGVIRMPLQRFALFDGLGVGAVGWGLHRNGVRFHRRARGCGVAFGFSGSGTLRRRFSWGVPVRRMEILHLTPEKNAPWRG